MAFGKTAGLVCLAYLRDGHFEEEWFTFPQEVSRASARSIQKAATHNVYFCPHLFSEPHRKKEYVSSAPTAWSDLDECPPNVLMVEPSILWRSSNTRYQALWILDDATPADAEKLSQRIAYHHSEDGADRSGWDLTQLLRVPGTKNWKYLSELGPQMVMLSSIPRTVYSLDDFEDYPDSKLAQAEALDMPSQATLDTIGDGEALLAGRGSALNPKVWELFNEQPKQDWSSALWQLQMLLYENGFSREEAFLICGKASCNKYRRDGRDSLLLWREVCKAYARKDHQAGLISDDNEVALLSAGEEELVARSPETFVERYIRWASGLGDAASQYHQAGAFTALSTLLCGHVKLPTSFGTFVPNLWFMILADTTLTRKTTAMDIAMDLIAEIDGDALLATDGSIEGLMTSLATRPGRPSIFLRDEFSGLLEAMLKKDYMAGMPELFTKLYDGKGQKRILRKETIDVRDPRLIMFTGGIKNKVTSILTHEQVSSGFMPRFIFITAESDTSRVKPIGPPTEQTDNGRGVIQEELIDLYNHYNRSTISVLPGTEVKIEIPLVIEASMTQATWNRYNKLEMDLMEAGLSNPMTADIMTPTYDRLAKSILKAALLLSASRQRSETVVVDEMDLLKAIHYGNGWKRYADEVMSNVGKGPDERLMMSIANLVTRNPGILRSKIMQHHHLSAKRTEELLTTMSQRGLVIRSKQGKGEQLLPTTLGRFD